MAFASSTPRAPAISGRADAYDNLPDHLRQGLFKQAGHFPIIVRLSTAFNRSDRVRSPRGFAIKVLGVTGAKALGDDDSTNQDLLLVNHPSYFADAMAYMRAQHQVERTLFLPDLAYVPIGFLARVLVAASDRTGIPIPIVLKALGDAGSNILGETFHTEGALRFGDYIARLRLVPISASVRQLTGQPCHDADDAVLNSVVAFFKDNAAEYELFAQLCTDLKRTPYRGCLDRLARRHFATTSRWQELRFRPRRPTARPVASIRTMSCRSIHGDVSPNIDRWAPSCAFARRLTRHPALFAMKRTRDEKNGHVMKEPRDISEFPD